MFCCKCTARYNFLPYIYTTGSFLFWHGNFLSYMFIKNSFIVEKLHYLSPNLNWGLTHCHYVTLSISMSTFSIWSKGPTFYNCLTSFPLLTRVIITQNSFPSPQSNIKNVPISPLFNYKIKCFVCPYDLDISTLKTQLFDDINLILVSINASACVHSGYLVYFVPY